MTAIEQALAQADREVAAIVEERTGELIAMLKARGATLDEITAEVMLQTRTLADQWQAQRVKLEAWLRRGGEALN